MLERVPLCSRVIRSPKSTETSMGKKTGIRRKEREKTKRLYLALQHVASKATHGAQNEESSGVGGDTFSDPPPLCE